MSIVPCFAGIFRSLRCELARHPTNNCHATRRQEPYLLARSRNTPATLVILLIAIFLFCSFVTGAWAEKFSFAVFGDNRDGDAIFRKLIDRINQDPEVRFGVACGDLTPHGKADEFRRYLAMTERCRVKIYPVIGNHDIVSSRDNFSKFLGPRYYSYDFENSHFVVLDNVSQRGLGEEQRKWLEGDLAKHTMSHAFVFMHKPLEDPSGYYPHYVMRPRQEAEQLLRLFQRSRVRYVCFGHIHGYGREERDGIVFLLSGGAGSPLYLPHFAGGFFHYVKVTVDGSRIRDEVVAIEP